MKQEETYQAQLLQNLTYVVFDLETTGFGGDSRIVEIAALRLEGWEPVEEFQTLVNPEISIPASAAKVHQIDNAMVQDAPTFQEIASGLAHFCQDAVLVGHNIFSFDLRFLTKELRRVFGAGPNNWAIDTLPLARRLLDQPSYKLEELATHYNIPIEAHQAMSDVYATTEIWLHLYREVLRRGGRSLEDLSRFSALRELDGSGLPKVETRPQITLKSRKE